MPCIVPFVPWLARANLRPRFAQSSIDRHHSRIRMGFVLKGASRRSGGNQRILWKVNATSRSTAASRADLLGGDWIAAIERAQLRL
uniref:Uncharacterized protein n=1 Tax=Physcomitrium patens TaxID=3218 RepID=A0A2K1IBM2_PHYPA|nr:hypothetical protein PHYPA_030171 [Physcomitrium patens]